MIYFFKGAVNEKYLNFLGPLAKNKTFEKNQGMKIFGWMKGLIVGLII